LVFIYLLNENFFVGYSPERINPADKVNTLTSITKVVSGSNVGTTEVIDELYRSIGITTHVAPNMMVAEMSKAIENAQRDLNISFVNEVAMYCNLLGIDTNDVLDAASTKWNFLPFKAGLVGGHCISVDPYYLIHKAEGLGFYPNVIASGRKVNDGMPKFIVSNLIKEMIRKGHNMENFKVLLLGITFKENIPDIRNSKVIDLFYELAEYNATIDVFDPYVNDLELQLKHQITTIDIIKGTYDAIIYAVDHDKFEEDILSFANENAVIYDLKGVLPRDMVDIRL
jgi:UDP-N-acetyl-D-galactosamine dehydrogenase